jgi:hypothetical protein
MGKKSIRITKKKITIDSKAQNLMDLVINRKIDIKKGILRKIILQIVKNLILDTIVNPVYKEKEH